MTAQPLTAQPLTAQPMTAQPMTAQPMTAQPYARRHDAGPPARAVSRRALFPALVVALLATGPPAGAGQEPRGGDLQERRVIILRGDSDHLVELEPGRGRRGFLGVALLDLTAELRTHFGVPPDRGVLVSRVVDGSPAQAADLRVGDVLTAIDGRPLAAALHLQLAIAKGRDGDEVALECRRDGEPLILHAVLAAHDRPQLDISPLLGLHTSIGAPLARGLGVESAGSVDVDTAWVESVAGSVGARFAEPSVLEQLEAMRVERHSLLEKLDRMEQRLRDLETELAALAGDDR